MSRLAGAVEHRRRHRHAFLEVTRQLEHFLVVELVEAFLLAAGVVVDLLEEAAHLRRLRLCLEHAADLEAEPLGRPAQVRLEHLADVHARGHAQRIEHDVDRRAVLEVRHVFDRHDGGDDALVAMTAGHLVAGLHAAFHRQVHLDHLEHAGGEIVTRRDLGALLLETLVERLLLSLRCAQQRLPADCWPPRRRRGSGTTPRAAASRGTRP